MADLKDKLVAIGLDEKKAAEATKNTKLAAMLASVLDEAGVPPCEAAVGKLLYLAATKVCSQTFQ